MLLTLKKVSSMVLKLLETDPQTRNSDDYLYCMVCRMMLHGTTSTTIGCSAEYLLTHRKDLGLPSFETVRRTRQKIQAEQPELKACVPVEAARTELEAEYKAFALGQVTC